MVATSPTSAWCELVMPDGKKLVFHEALSPEFLKALIG
jgi:hypothetical protein